MSENVFTEKEIVPSDTLVKKKLGSGYSHLKEIRQFVKEISDESVEEWKYYGKKTGWLLKILINKRNLFFIIICENFFKIVFVFGEKAVKVIKEEDISPVLKDELLSARKYVEGRALRITVKDSKYLSDIQRLIEIKINN